jgi:hypothetical protein
MLKEIRNNKGMQLVLGLIFGIIFGFLLQKGGVSNYDVILGQLRLQDFTVLKIMLSAVIVTMIGISILRPSGLVKLHVKGGSLKNSILGGLLFGVGFGTLGYCPGTIAAAVGSGNLDGLIGGMIGIIIGTGIFASMYSKMREKKLVTEDRFSKVSLFDKVEGNSLKLTVPIAVVIFLFMVILEIAGF